ncbi:50S ribosomal protein L13 [Candidatus Woesearchaeota archaeon]|nr:50S ribosomal protein L13 [Candidatus Woesearchaeota archaeon]
MIVDATDLIVGRMATRIAKMALLGEKVDVVNCEKAIITGSRRQILARYFQKRNFGEPLKGPVQFRMPDRFVRRIIRGMLPHKKEKGKVAFKRIMCYIGVPDEFKDQKLETFEDANVRKIKNTRFTTILDISREIGAKI